MRFASTSRPRRAFSLLALLLVLAGCQPLRQSGGAPLELSTATYTAAASLVASATCTATASPSCTPMATSSPSSTSTSTATYTPSATPTGTPTITRTPSPTQTPVPLPAVAASYPIDGDLGLKLDARLAIDLAQPLRPAQVEASLSFSPTLAGTIEWANDQRVVFSPQSLITTTAYAMTVTLRSLRDQMAPAQVFTATFATGNKGTPLPILMYHRFRELEDGVSQGQRDWSVSPAAFQAQMDLLAERGYHAISLAQLGAYLMEQEPLPPRPVVISIDDGWQDVYDVAWPILRDHGFMANLLVLPTYAEHSIYFMEWPELLDLQAGGFCFGSHSLTHPDLRTLSPADAQNEICDSKEQLEAHLGQAITVFAYPDGGYNGEIISMLQGCGYQMGLTLIRGFMQSTANDGLFQLKRIWVSYDTTIDEFAARLPW